MPISNASSLKTNPDELVSPPVVTIMGHVDTANDPLDTLRNSRVATVKWRSPSTSVPTKSWKWWEDYLLDYTDAAFTYAGAQHLLLILPSGRSGRWRVTPQTIEASTTQKAANVPNHCGLITRSINQEPIQSVMNYRAWSYVNCLGGDSEFVEISAKFNQNIDELFWKRSFLWLESKNSRWSNCSCHRYCYRKRVDSERCGRSPPCSTRYSRPNVTEQFWRVRAMTTTWRECGIHLPGFYRFERSANGGDHFAVYEDEESARAAGEERTNVRWWNNVKQPTVSAFENLFDTWRLGGKWNLLPPSLKPMYKVWLFCSLQKIEVEGERPSFTSSCAINESDDFGRSFKCLHHRFNARPISTSTSWLMIELSSPIICEVIEEMKMKGMLTWVSGENIGEAVIRETFKVSKVVPSVDLWSRGHDSKVRVIRDGVVIHDGFCKAWNTSKMMSLWQISWAGLMIEGYSDIKTDDTISFHIMEEIASRGWLEKRTFSDSSF